MSDHYQDVYNNHADAYHALVMAEDVDHRVSKAVTALLQPSGKTIVDVGAGTGRVSQWLLNEGASVVAVEPAAAMRTRARLALARWPTSQWKLQQGSAGSLPLRDHWVDAAVEGWAFGHVCSWQPESWRARSVAFLAELVRVVRPGGTIVLIETAGTCVETPTIPESLRPLYTLWSELGFTSRDLPSDYQFASLEQATQVMGAFFGVEMATAVQGRGATRVPEWTRVFTHDVNGLARQLSVLQ